MQITPQLQEYFDFLAWFASTHPELNKAYWQHITIPKDGEGVGIIDTGLDTDTLARIRQVQYDYYHAGK